MRRSRHSGGAVYRSRSYTRWPGIRSFFMNPPFLSCTPQEDPVKFSLLSASALLILSHQGELIRGPSPPHIPHPASIWVDWDSVDGTVYEIQWFGDAPLTLMVGSTTGANSEMEIQCLERGKQYWFGVRAVRAGKVGSWSDQATRVANI